MHDGPGFQLDGICADHPEPNAMLKQAPELFAEALSSRRPARRPLALSCGELLGLLRQDRVYMLEREQSDGVTARVKYQTSGFHTWTEGEIAKFRTRHSLGSRARLALEIILWTGQRRGDAHRFGPPHVRDGRINYEQEKGGKEQLWLPMAPQLRAAIDVMPSIGVQTFLETEVGKPFSKAGFGNCFVTDVMKLALSIAQRTDFERRPLGGLPRMAPPRR
jgi:hypothetical protein